MSTPAQFWNQIHPSVFHEAAGPLLAAEATPRPQGALRYQCPINGSFVLVTDDETLSRFDGAHVRLRCSDCGEMHLLTGVASGNPAGHCRRSAHALRSAALFWSASRTSTG